MLQRPRATVVGVPPCARTMPAARLLAPSPSRPRSRTTTRSAPDGLAKYEAQPPTVPAPTMTRSARFSLMIPRLRAYYRMPPACPPPQAGEGNQGTGRSWLGNVATPNDQRGHAGEDEGVSDQHQHRDTGGDDRRGGTRSR